MNNDTVYCNVCNLIIREKELDFGDFKIKRINGGGEAKYWMEKISHHIHPRAMIERKYQAADDNEICDLIDELQLLFRLYKPGDIILDYIYIEKGNDPPSKIYRMAVISSLATTRLYHLGEGDIKNFNIFRESIKQRSGYKNKLFKHSLAYFELGVDKPLVDHIRGLSKIVNYVIALEMLFLIDNKNFSISKLFKERIARFLNDKSLSGMLNDIYKIRSNIVHGRYIDEKIDVRKNTNNK